jgi:hypothetical protein
MYAEIARLKAGVISCEKNTRQAKPTAKNSLRKPSYSFAFLSSYSRHITGRGAAQNGTYRFGIYAAFSIVASTETQRTVWTETSIFVVIRCRLSFLTPRVSDALFF